MQRRLFLVGMLVCLVNLSAAEDAVQFSDPQLKRAVEDALQIFDPTPTDMLWLTSLKASGRKISDLKGLEYAKNLQTLRLTHNQISDLSPLSSLKNLWKLVPNNNYISDLSPLSSLTQLKHLDIHENRISDLSPLASLTNLEHLNIHPTFRTSLTSNFLFFHEHFKTFFSCCAYSYLAVFSSTIRLSILSSSA